MDRRSRGHRSIFSACLDDDNESLERLFEGCSDSVQTVRDVNDSGQTALHIAASCGSYRCASFLLSKGADPMQRDLESGYTPLHIALYKGNIFVRVLFTKYHLNFKAGEFGVTRKPFNFPLKDKKTKR